MTRTFTAHAGRPCSPPAYTYPVFPLPRMRSVSKYSCSEKPAILGNA